ncbi:ArsC family reductase [Aliagarivorans marinus]|uniref:ArsC family reductase n=1 Tax=Aliagarivorans marinus TaxID=561965 RepID=UPI000404783B|nr:ArsC family reductase [Aliagarivorans marinus]
MQHPTVFGISNCDTIRKARRWLSDNGIDYSFHDYRKDGLEQAQLTQWCETLGWEALLNKRGTTFRQLSDEQKAGLDQAKAIALMLEHPAMIKRPLLVAGEQQLLGFKADQYQQFFAEVAND